ncbi:MAG TPA: DUF1097 domain-containing protein [Alphaproteobacteria bacterium]|jgi:hypothetical protein|nr:DUF1097 domain-containing protein [Alphaproteobacteria bacterium]
MTSLVALSVSIGVLGAIATWLALGPLSGFYIVWVGFIAWATFFATGGNNEALKTTIVSGIWGAVCAWVALLVIGNVSIGLDTPIWGAIVVGVTVLILCLGAHVDALKNIPAGVYGYAATAGVGLLMQGADVTAVGFNNPLIVVSVSIVIGAVFGLLSGKLAGVLGKG